MLIAARFVQGVGGAMTSAVILGMIVTMFPEPREQAKAIGVYGFVASAGALDRPAGRRRADRGDQLALDLLRQHPDRDRHGRRSRMRLLEKDKGIGLGRGADVLGARADHRRADARRLHDRQAGRRRTAGPPARTLGLGAVALALLVGVRRARGDRARTRSIPLRIFRSRNVSGANVDPGAVRRRHVRDVLPRRAVPAAGARLRRAARSAWRSCPRRSSWARCRCATPSG